MSEHTFTTFTTTLAWTGSTSACSDDVIREHELGLASETVLVGVGD